MFDDLETNGQNGANQTSAAKTDLNGNIGDKNHLFDKNTNVGKEKIDDIFSDTDSLAKPAPFQPKAQTDPETEVSENNNYGNNNLKKALVLAGFVFVLAVIIIGGYIVINKILSKGPVIETSQEDQNKEQSEIEENNDIEKEAKVEEKNEEIIQNDEEKDTDQDGLSDAEEKRLGLSIDNPDSDGDGLFDREEVKIYRTDPLNKDTDGDGYLDGDEVKAGYNPNGDGKLFDLP